MFYNNTTNIFGTLVPLPTTASSGAYLYNDGTKAFWAYPGAAATQIGSTLQYRSIITHGYQHGGYKDSNTWRSLNKTWHSTDVTVYCGEQLDKAFAYAGSTFSDYNGYAHCTTNTAFADSSHTSSYSLATGVQRTVNTGLAGGVAGSVPFGYTGNDPNAAGISYGSSGSATGVGSWDLTVARSYCWGTQDQINQVGYIGGGSTNANTPVDKFQFNTEIMFAGPQPSPTVTAVSHATAAGGSSNAYWNFGGTLRNLTFVSDVWATWSPGTTISPDGVCKAMPTKLGYHYFGTTTSTGVGLATINDSNGSYLNNGLSKPINTSEENFMMGQNWGYMIGTYYGGQSLYSSKLNYLTSTWSAVGNATLPKGHNGASSGGTTSAAATVTAGAI
jgi:hypothetical protein